MYLSLINKGKTNEKLNELLGLDENLNLNGNEYIDVIITFTETEESDKYLKNIPRIRIYFK